MKKYLIFVISFILLVSVSGCSTPCFDGKNFYLAERVESEPPAERTLLLNGETIKLEYRGPASMSTVDDNRGNLPDGYGFLEEYYNEEGNLYTYFSGTDVLCAMLKFEYDEEDKDVCIRSYEEATAFAKDYLRKIYGDVVDEYEFDRVHDEKYSDIYAVYFHRVYHGYSSEDVLGLSVSTRGTVKSFSAHFLNRFEKVDFTEEQVKAAEERCMEEIKQQYPGHTIKVEKKIICYYEGKLCLRLSVFYRQGAMGQSFYEPIIE